MDADTFPAAYAITVGGRLYGYGETLPAARNDFAVNIAAEPAFLRTALRMASELRRLTAEEASEAECVSADAVAVGWA